MISNDQAILQVSWVVPDLEAAVRRWHASMGIGPFLISRHIQINEPRYRGRPQVTDFSTAIAQAGPIQIELVEQHNDGPSCYRDTVPAGQEAMHHVALIADDYDAVVARYLAEGMEIAADGRFGDVRFAYFDARPGLGHMIEVLEDKPTIRRFFGAIRKAAENWDGDPATLMRDLG